MAKKTKREKVSEESWMNQVANGFTSVSTVGNFFDYTIKYIFWAKNTLCTPLWKYFPYDGEIIKKYFETIQVNSHCVL